MNLSNRIDPIIPREFLEKLRFLSKAAQKFKLTPYLVGGVVRDLLMDAAFNQDLDVTLSGGNVLPLAQFLAKQWKADLLAYPQFLTYTLQFKDHAHIDLITTRKEKYPKPASLPVVEPGSLNDDLLRRDFSVNAMAVALEKAHWGELVDPLKGFDDLHAKKIRILHTQSFKDDPTRIFRAARFAGRLGFQLEQKTSKILLKTVQLQEISKLSADRVRVEIEKILEEENPAPPLRLLSEWKVLRRLGSEIEWNVKVRDEILAKIKLPARRLAIFLLENNDQSLRVFLRQYNFPNQFQKEFSQIVEIYQNLKSGLAIEKMPVVKMDPECVELFNCLVSLFADKNLKKRWDRFLRWQETVPTITGDDLKKIGFPPGPVYKKILGAVRAAKFKGKAQGKIEEIRYVIDNFRRA